MQILEYDESEEWVIFEKGDQNVYHDWVSPADVKFVQTQAATGNVSVAKFSRDAIMKAARNAAYLAKLDRAFKQNVERRCTPHELIEADGYVDIFPYC